MTRRRARLAALLALAALLRGGAQPATAGAPLEVERVDVASHPSVTLTVTAPRELIGVDLGAEQFAVLEDRVRREVRVRRLPSTGIEVVLVVDTSGSMQGGAMAAAKAAASDFVRAMPAEARIGVVGFGDSPSVAAPLGTPDAGLVGAVARLRADGETALYDALVTAGEQFSTGTTATRRFVVLLSDGGDTVSTATLAEAGAGLARINAGFYAVALATSESDDRALRRLVRAAGGRLVRAGRVSELAAVYEGIASQLVNQYEISYRSGSGGPTNLDVSVASGSVVAQWRDRVDLPPLPVPPPPPEPVRPYEAPAPGFFAQGWWLVAGLAPVVVALAIGGFMYPSAKRRPRLRRLARELGAVGPAAGPTLVQEVAGRATGMAERVLAGGERSSRLNDALERAGLAVRPAEFLVMVASIVAGGFAVALLTLGPLFALVVGAALGGGSAFVLSAMQKRRRRKLADQFGDTLQLLAGSLRSGHGLIQAIDVVTREAESPTAEEFHRVIVEARLGRDLGESLDALAERAGNEDIEWVVQAIRIHREVGGDLAEVLDRVGETIRDRNRVRGQIRSLTAEGRLSAIILMALPFLVGAWMYMTNRSYVSELWTRSQGRMVLMVGAVLMTLGALVLKRLVRPEF